jgi:hypothetical protein
MDDKCVLALIEKKRLISLPRERREQPAKSGFKPVLGGYQSGTLV